MRPGWSGQGPITPIDYYASMNKRASQTSSAPFLQQKELAHRWRISPRTLERWRWLKTGPSYVKLGSKVLYSLEDVEAFERRRRAEMNSSILGSWR
jgi:hypothetical protein